jgi:hypothetical protein
MEEHKTERSTDSTPKKGDPPPNWRAKFLTELASTGNVTHSAKAAVVDKKTVYNHRHGDPDFAAAWLEAIDEANDTLEAEARRRAVNGVVEPVYQGGQKVGEILKYSDTLLIFLLKGNRPDKFRENLRIGGDDNAPPVKVEHSGNAITLLPADILAAARLLGVESGNVLEDGGPKPLDTGTGQAS